MFLTQLSEEQKQSFMALAHAIVLADNVLAQSEESMMAQYRQEMALREDGNITQEQARECFTRAARDVQKKVLFELLALACADAHYVPEEQTFMEKLRTDFDLDETFLAACMEKLTALTALYQEIGQLVNG